MADTRANRSRYQQPAKFTTAVDETGRRVPPQDLAAEKAVIGALMLNTSAFHDVVDVLNGADFYSPAFEKIFRAEVALFESGKPVDQITVVDELTRTGELQAIGGPDVIYDVVDAVPTSANVEFYAQIVKDLSTLRRMIGVGTTIEQLGYTTDGADVEGALNVATEKVFELVEGSSATDVRAASEAMEATMERIRRNLGKRDDEVDGVPTGIRDLDHVLHGLKGGQMIVVAARPGVGKSTWANGIAMEAALHNNMPTVIFNLEMGMEEVLMRLISAELSIDANLLTKGYVWNSETNRKTEELTEEHLARIQQFSTKLEGKPLYIDDSVNMSITQIRTKCLRLKEEHKGNLGLVILDYLQLMQTPERSESRQQAVADMSRKLKLLAKELDWPVIAIAQLGRESEKDDRRPRIDDLRESGAIEQDADVVLLIHDPTKNRNDEWKSKNQDKLGKAEIIIGKNRAGQTRTIDVAAQLNFSRFKDLVKSSDFPVEG